MTTTGPTDGVYPVPSTPAYDAPPPAAQRDVSTVSVSHFANVKTTFPKGPVTAATWLEGIRDGAMAQSVSAVRTASPEDVGRLKNLLSATSWSGTFPQGRRGNVPDQPSGLIFVDLDDYAGAPSDWQESEKARLSAFESVVGVYRSCGRGIHAVVAVAPAPTTKSDYKKGWEAVTAHLGVTATVDKATKDITRLALVSHDEHLYINFRPVPLTWEPAKRQATTPKPLGADSTAPGHGGEQDIEALARLEVPQDYNPWLSWLATLKSAGFTVQQVESWSSTGPKSQPGEVSEKWEGLPSDSPPVARQRFWAAVRNLGTEAQVDGESWAAPDELTSTFVRLPPLPLPPPVAKYVNAVQELSGCSTGTGHAVTLSAINLLVADMLDVQTLAPDPLPTSLIFVTSCPSGGRKSTAFGLAWKAHKLADSEINRRWQAAQRSAPFADDADLSLPTRPGRVRPTAPRAIRSDTTIEAAVMNLSDGRPTQSLATAEAGKVLNGWSFSKGQRPHALSIINDLYTGEDSPYDRADKRASFYVEDKRLTVLLAGHQSEIAGLLLSEDAANGFSARTLLSFESRNFSPDTTHEWPEDETPRQHVDRLQGLITRVRALQDEGMEYADTEHTPRKVLQPSESARCLLSEYMDQCTAGLAEEPGPHLESFLVRAAEQAARYAANLSAFRQMDANDGAIEDLTYGSEDVSAAIAVVEWHRAALAGFLEQESIDDDVAAATAIIEQIRDWAEDDESRIIRLRTLIATKASGRATRLRKSVEGRRRVIKLLQETRHVKDLGNGRFEVHPLVLASA